MWYSTTPAVLNYLFHWLLTCTTPTQEKLNVIFYQRLGFKVADESMCPVGEGYTSWTMVREPVLRQEEEEEGEEGEKGR